MLSTLKFILDCVIDFIKMLFTINLGNGLNLGLLMCILFIFLPIMLRIVNFLKMYSNEVIADELDLKSSPEKRRKK